MRNILIFNILNFVLVFFSTPVILAQNSGQEMSYMRYEGTIDNNIKLIANLVKTPPLISGNYQYKYLETDATMHIGRTIELSGEVDKNNTVRLREFGRDQFAFEGELSNDVFKGYWYAVKDRKLPFTMKEYYPNGPMAFDVFYLHSEEALVSEDPESPLAEIELTLVFPANAYIQPEIEDSVKRFIVRSYFGEGFHTENPDSMLVHFEQEYMNTYKLQNENWHKLQGASFNWEKVMNMSVIYNTGYMLCLEYIKYAYSGGAHGMTNISYDIIDLADGRLLTYTDVFAEGTDEALADILTRQLRKDYSIPDDVTLTEAGFFVEEVSPNRNIYVNGNGVGFLYNSYEIAPYSQGATNIFLEFKQIRELIKMGSPVYKMSHP
ncbi:MAG: DUF3298 domain-containing protein [bacterium]